MDPKWKNIKKFDQNKNFKPWIFQIAKNTSIDYLRRKKSIPFSRFENEKGQNLLVENFPGVESPFVTADELLEAVGKVPGLKITFDNGNAFTGEDPAESFRKSVKHVVHIHFKDWDVSNEKKEGYREVRKGGYNIPALIGEGAVNQKSCLDAIRDSGYEGYINIEYEGGKYNAYEGVERAVNYLRSIEE